MTWLLSGIIIAINWPKRKRKQKRGKSRVSNTLQIRRGTKAELDLITLSAGELGWTTDTKGLYIGDGANNKLYAMEYIDWEATGAEDVHNDRIPASAVTQHVGAIDHNSLLNTHNLTTDIDHNQLANLTVGDVHTQYLNVARHDLTARHSLGTVVPHDTLNGLTDTDAGTPSNDDVLTYKSGTGKWEPHAGGGGAVSYAFRTITGITNDVVADLAEDTLTLSSANNLLSIVGTAATDTITFTVNQANLDHGSIGGLGDSADHTWALLVDGTRPLTADWNIGNFKLGINTVPSYPLHIVSAPGDANFTQIVGDMDPTGTLTATRTHTGLALAINTNVDKNGNAYIVQGLDIDIVAESDSVLTTAYGANIYIINSAASTISELYGGHFVTQMGAGTASNLYGFNIETSMWGSGESNKVYGVRYVGTMNSSGKTVAEYYGHYTGISRYNGTVTTAYLYYGLYSGTFGTKWGIYLDGETKNYFSGQVGIKETTPAADLDIAGTLILLNGTSINEFSTDGTLAGDSDDAVPTEKAVKAYVDNTGFQSKARGYRAAAQTIPQTEWTKVELNNESFDVLSEFDSTTNFRFTASQAGYYLVFGQVSSAYAVADGFRYITRIYKNGSFEISSDKSMGSAQYTNQSVSGIVYLAATHYLELWFYHTDASNDIVNTPGDTFMTVHRIS